jgi:hypothetical protein
MSEHNDIKLVKWLFLLLLLPLTLAIFSGDRFRYPCQDPANWDKDFCKFPICDVTRTCPDHIFKGQRDPRLGPPKDVQTQPINQSFTPAVAPTCPATPTQGANCGK